MNKIENYIDSVIPKNIPKSKQQKLKAEIESHIFDRIDFYTEIGYDIGVSVDKALEDMGQDEETKNALRNDFEEIHYERKWWAVLTGIMLILVSTVYTLIELITSLNYVGFDGEGTGTEFPKELQYSFLTFSFVMIFAVVTAMIFFYKKGYRKCLISLGVSHLVTLIVPYSMTAICSFIDVLAYLVTRDTDILLNELNDVLLYSYSYAIDFYVLAILILCFVLAYKVRKYGRPQKTYWGTVIFCILFALVFTVTVKYAFSAAIYLEFETPFSENQDIQNDDAQKLYSQLNRETTPAQLQKIMEESGYITTDRYAETLDEDVAKKFKSSVQSMTFFFSENYEIWFSPSWLESDNFNKGNGFVFILTDKKGKIKSKGVGNAFENVYTYTDKTQYDVISDCVDTFLSYNGGESMNDVLDYFGNEQGRIYGEFTTYTETGENNYYRIQCYGLDTSSKLVSDINDKYIELSFENGVLVDGKLHYQEFYVDPKTSETEIRNRYFTLAD